MAEVILDEKCRRVIEKVITTRPEVTSLVSKIQKTTKTRNFNNELIPAEPIGK